MEAPLPPDLNMLLERAETWLRRDGHVQPMLVVEGRRETAILDIGPVWGPTSYERRLLLYRLGMLLGFGLDAVRAIAVFDGYFRTGMGDTPTPLVASGSLEDDPEAKDALFVVEMKADGGVVLIEAYDKIVNLDGTTFLFEPTVAGEGFARSGTFAEFWRGLREVEGLMRLGAERYGESLERAREIVSRQFPVFFPGVRQVVD